MTTHIPNTLTSLNLLCGCIAAVMCFDNQLEVAAYFIFASAIFDLFDGMAARRFPPTKHSFGKELDSLADVISFGFVPGAIMHKLFLLSMPADYFRSEIVMTVLQFFPFMITVFAALRLARFNVDTQQTNSFLGLPTPAMGLFVVSLPLVMKQFPGMFDEVMLNPYFILGLSGLLSLFMVVRIPLFSLKFKSFAFKDNIFQYLLIALSLILFPVFLFAAIPVLIILYIFLSLIESLTKAKSS